MDEELKKRLTQGLSFTEARQRLLDFAAYHNAEEGIRQGIYDFENGRTRPAREVFDDLRRKYDIHR